jgi:four helix bundle protein
MGQSKASFNSKLSIVLEETDESCFWMEFIIEEVLIMQELVQPLLNEGEELRAIFTSSLKTSGSSKKK